MGLRTSHRVAALVVGAVVVVGAVSCGGSDGDTLSRDELIDQLTEGDEIPVETAECIADGIEREGIVVDAEGEPSAEEESKATSIAIECFAASTGMDPSEIPGYDPTDDGGS